MKFIKKNMANFIRALSEVCMKSLDYKIVEDVPSHLNQNTLYLVKDEYKFWLAVFKCPCGCRADIHLNLLPDSNPRWQVKFDFIRRVSFYPSIWRTQNCKSHFLILKSKIVWCGKSRL